LERIDKPNRIFKGGDRRNMKDMKTRKDENVFFMSFMSLLSKTWSASQSC
jgi:hypothetical protein